MGSHRTDYKLVVDTIWLLVVYSFYTLGVRTALNDPSLGLQGSDLAHIRTSQIGSREASIIEIWQTR